MVIKDSIKDNCLGLKLIQHKSIILLLVEAIQIWHSIFLLIFNVSDMHSVENLCIFKV